MSDSVNRPQSSKDETPAAEQVSLSPTVSVKRYDSDIGNTVASSVVREAVSGTAPSDLWSHDGEEVISDVELAKVSYCDERNDEEPLIMRAIITADSDKYFKSCGNESNTKRPISTSLNPQEANGSNHTTAASTNPTPVDATDPSELDNTRLSLWFIEVPSKRVIEGTGDIGEKARQICRTLSLEVVVALEMVHRHNKMSYPSTCVGLLAFLCSRAEAMFHLKRGFIRHADLVNRTALITWITRSEYVIGPKVDEGIAPLKLTQKNSVELGEEGRWKEIMQVITNKLVTLERNASKDNSAHPITRLVNSSKIEELFISTAPHVVSTWKLAGKLSSWCEKPGSLKGMWSGASGSEWNPFASAFCFFHFQLRRHTSNILSLPHLIQLLKRLDFCQQKTSPTEDDEQIPIGTDVAELTEEEMECEEGVKMTASDRYIARLCYQLKHNAIPGSQTPEDTLECTNARCINTVFNMGRTPVEFIRVMAVLSLTRHEEVARANDQMLQLLKQKRDHEQIFAEKVYMAKQRARINLESVEVFQIKTTEELTETNIAKIPASIFDPGVQTWCEQVKNEIDEACKVHTVLSGVFKDMKCVCTHQSLSKTYGSAELNRAFIRLYIHNRTVEHRQQKQQQNNSPSRFLADSFDQLRDSIIEASSINYSLISGNLSKKRKDTVDWWKQMRELCSSPSEKESSLRKNNNTGVDFIRSALLSTMTNPYKHHRLLGSNSVIHATFISSALQGSPLWKHATANGYVFHSLSRRDRSGHKKKSAAKTTELLQILQRDMLPTGDEMKATCEMTTPLMNVKNCIWDIDLHASPKIPMDNQLGPETLYQLCTELVDLVEFTLVSRIGLQPEDVVVHYIARSEKDECTTHKVGLRYILALSPNVELSTYALSQITTILNTFRNFYELLKRFNGSGSRQEIFDQNIYGRDGRACHGIRMVYQSKILDQEESVLKPIFKETRKARHSVCNCQQSDEPHLTHCMHCDPSQLIPYEHRFVHGGAAMIRPGSVPLSVRVIESFVHLNPIENEQFLDANETRRLHNHVKKAYAKDMEGIMEEMDKKIVFSTPSDPILNRVCEVVHGTNEILAMNRACYVKRLDDGGFSVEVIEAMMRGLVSFQLLEGQVHLAYNNPSLVASTDKKVLDFCLFEPHRKKQRAFVWAGYHYHTQEIAILCKCFKSSCNSKCLASRFSLPLLDMFVFPFVRQRFVSQVLVPMNKLYHNNELNIIYLETNTDPHQTMGQGMTLRRKKCVEMCIGNGERDRFRLMTANSDADSELNSYVRKCHGFLYSADKMKMVLSVYCCDVFDPVSRRRLSIFRIPELIYLCFSVQWEEGGEQTAAGGCSEAIVSRYMYHTNSAPVNICNDNVGGSFGSLAQQVRRKRKMDEGQGNNLPARPCVYVAESSWKLRNQILGDVEGSLSEKISWLFRAEENGDGEVGEANPCNDK